MTVRELKLFVIDNAEVIAKILHKGKDVEIRKSPKGISIAEKETKVVVR